MAGDNFGNKVPDSLEEPVLRSRWTKIGTCVYIAALIVLYFFMRSREVADFIFWVVVAAIFIPLLWLYPKSVGFGDNCFYIKRLFTTKVIPFDMIKSVRVFVPSPSDGMICGSRGLFGRIGWFKSWEVGLYFAYVGDTDQSFLIELSPDDKSKERRYVVSCRDNVRMVEALDKALKKFKS